MKNKLKKLTITFFAAAIMLSTGLVNISAHEAKDPELQEFVEELEKDAPDVSKQEFDAMVEETAKQVEFMAKNGIITFDENGFISYVDVDKFESVYGADANTAELR